MKKQLKPDVFLADARYENLVDHLETADTDEHPIGHILIALAGLIDIVGTLEERIAALEVKPEPEPEPEPLGTSEGRRAWWAALPLEEEL